MSNQFVELKDKFIPKEAYLYNPLGDEVRFGQQLLKKQTRRIFEGSIELDSFEHEEIVKFREFMDKQKQKLDLIPWWNEPRIQRYLQASQFNHQKTLEFIRDHQKWRIENLPPKINDPALEILNSGMFYQYGRDHRYRPIIVFNAPLIPVKNMNLELMFNAMTIFFEYIIDKMMIPGQIENWVVIVNLGNMGVSDIPINSLKTMIKHLSSTWRSRLFANYIVNATGFINMVWSMVKAFLEESTIKKISFYKTAKADPLFTHCPEVQIEEKFGGTLDNLTKNYWPPKNVGNQNRFNQKEIDAINLGELEKNKKSKKKVEIQETEKIYTEQEYFDNFIGGKYQNSEILIDLIENKEKILNFLENIEKNDKKLFSAINQFQQSLDNNQKFELPLKQHQHLFSYLEITKAYSHFIKILKLKEEIQKKELLDNVNEFERAQFEHIPWQDELVSQNFRYVGLERNYIQMLNESQINTNDLQFRGINGFLNLKQQIQEKQEK